MNDLFPSVMRRIIVLLLLYLPSAQSRPPKTEKGIVLDFKCKDASLRIKQQWINDDYCDCPDGSDEPHTSACSHLLNINTKSTDSPTLRDATFTCLNLDHEQLIIPSSRVGDGICDCCDGSDERHEHDDAPKTVECENRCIALGLEIRKKKAKTQLLLRQGLRARAKMIDNMNSQTVTDLLELDQIKYDLENMKTLSSLIDSRKLTEEAIEYREQVWRAKFLFQRDEDELEEEKEDVKLKKQGGAEAEDTSRKRDTVKDNSHAILGDEPTKEEIDRIIEKAKTDNTTRIPRGDYAHRFQMLKDMKLFLSPPRLLSGITLTDIEENVPEQRNQHRDCKLSEFLEELPSETVSSKDMIGAKASNSGGLSLMDISIALGGIPPEVQGGSEQAHATARENRKWDRFIDGRKHGFMGPIFNGGRKGWSRGLRYILSGAGLIFSPARAVYEVASFGASIVSTFLKLITPSIISKPFNRRYRKLSKVLWVHIGVKVRRLWRRQQGPWAWRAFWNAVPELYRYYFPFVDKHHIRPEAEAMRSAYKEVTNQQKMMTDRINKLEKKILNSNSGNYGPKGIFNHLSEKCVEATFQGYKYEVCPFRKVSQNGHIQLGNWKGFGNYKKDDDTPESGSVPSGKGDDDDRFNMYLNWWFTGGQACYQGPKRRTVVHLKCGPEDVLEHVVEPETCMYEMIMRTPVACNPKDLDPEYDMVEEACWNRETSRCDTSRFSN
jgi:hypothetical protein